MIGGLRIGLVLTLCAASATAKEPPAANAEAFFETRIRPVLVETCFKCHGGEKTQNSLRVDSRAALVQGGDSGAAIVPGDVEKSLLIRAIRYHDDAILMPPDGPLEKRVVADFEAWIAAGAFWPEKRQKEAGGFRSERHWAFGPVRAHPIPLDAARWSANPIDAFIAHKQRAAGLTPAVPADRRTLLRRLSFDLVGLPPTFDEVIAFENDASPDAASRVVDRLLASPRYGERWGRHWLDVARYADTKGYVYDGELRRYPFSYTYRDYVIRAFNEDLPYDRFVLEQIAADQIVREGDDRRALAALGFLTLGRRFVNNIHDVIDDRLDVIFRGTQGLTVGCARCHDHKYDPIPTRDYYSLYGVLAGCTERTTPIGESPKRAAAATPAVAEFEKELAKRQKALADQLETKRAELSDRLRGKSTEYLIAVLEAEKQPSDDFYVILSADDLNPVIVRRWQSFLLSTQREFHPVFALWHALGAIPAAEFATKAPHVIRTLAADTNATRRINPRVIEAFLVSSPSTMRAVAERYGKLLDDAHRAWRDTVKQSAQKKSPPPAHLPDPALEQLRQVLYAADAPTTVPPVRIGEIETLFDEPTRVALNKAQAQVDQLFLDSPVAPPHAMVLGDLPTQRNPRVFVRGNPRVKGVEVPRQFVEVVAGDRRQPFARGSGRLELAQAIADPDNPLTARVMVNRVWMHHFGAGLVRTPSDFGTRCDPPSHPELLDHLARRFLDDGWSLKTLHRRILSSHAYQQSSASNPQTARVDPENRLLSRMNRRRLDFESLRDAVLLVAGRLDLSLYGRPVSLTDAPFSTRRSVYGLVDRQNLPGVLRVFDFANPDQHTPQRYATTAPQQALFLLNSPFLAEQARALAACSKGTGGDASADSIVNLYRTVYQRQPRAAEVELALRFLSTESQKHQPHQPPERLSPWQQYAQTLLLANEFVFLD
jgi:hypothetical protein